MKILMTQKAFIAFILCSLFLSNCKKDEGYGGKASIRGVVTELRYNEDFDVFQSARPALEEDVYIEFGSDHFVADNTKTSSDGEFEFQNLLPGKYTIYIYSDDSTRNSPTKIPVKKEITISKNSRIVNIDTLFKFKAVKFDDGTSSISGMVNMIYYINNFQTIREISPAQDEDVFIVYNNHDYYDLRVRTLYNGRFTATNLIKGHYTVYAYSDDPSGASEKLREIREVDITEDNQHIDVGTMNVNNK